MSSTSFTRKAVSSLLAGCAAAICFNAKPVFAQGPQLERKEPFMTLQFGNGPVHEFGFGDKPAAPQPQANAPASQPSAYESNGVHSEVMPIGRGDSEQLKINCTDMKRRVRVNGEEYPVDWKVTYDSTRQRGSYSGIQLISGEYYGIDTGFHTDPKSGQLVVDSPRVKALVYGGEKTAMRWESFIRDQARSGAALGKDTPVGIVMKEINTALQAAEDHLHGASPYAGQRATKVKGQYSFPLSVSGRGHTTQFGIEQQGANDRITLQTQFTDPTTGHQKTKTTSFVSGFTESPRHVLSEVVAKDTADTVRQNKKMGLALLAPDALEPLMTLEEMIMLADLHKATSPNAPMPFEDGMFYYRDAPLVEAGYATGKYTYTPRAGASPEQAMDGYIDFLVRERGKALKALDQDLQAAGAPSLFGQTSTLPVRQQTGGAQRPSGNIRTEAARGSTGQLKLLEDAASGKTPVYFGAPAGYKAPNP